MSLNVVIVDDVSSARIVSRHLLANIASDVTYIDFARPDHAIAWLTHNRADLLVVDFRMPVMDGIAFARVVRAQQHNRFAPIILLTLEDEEIRLKALEQGLDCVLDKGVDPRRFRAEARRLLKSNGPLM